MIRTIAFLAFLLPSLAPAEKLMLEADDYTLTFAHEVKHPKVAFPGDEIPMDEYLAVKGRKPLRLQFSKDREDVQILPLGISAELKSASGSERVYHLTKESFAGGRLEIEKTETGLRATFTQFGSGFPVISSAYGLLKQTIQKAGRGGGNRPASAPEPESVGITNAVYAKILLAVKTPPEGGHPPVELWIAQKLRKRGEKEFRAVTGWVRLPEKGEEGVAIWDATLDGKLNGCPVDGQVSERTADGRVKVSLTGWAPFPPEIKGDSLPAEIGFRSIAVVDTGRADGAKSYVALMIAPVPQEKAGEQD